MHTQLRQTYQYHLLRFNTMLLFVFFALIALYVYGVASTIVHAAYIKELDRRIAQTSSELASLESVYLQQEAALGVEDAYALGLAPVQEKQYLETTVVVGLTR